MHILFRHRRNPPLRVAGGIKEIIHRFSVNRVACVDGMNKFSFVTTVDAEVIAISLHGIIHEGAFLRTGEEDAMSVFGDIATVKQNRGGINNEEPKMIISICPASGKLTPVYPDMARVSVSPSPEKIISCSSSQGSYEGIREDALKRFSSSIPVPSAQ